MHMVAPLSSPQFFLVCLLPQHFALTGTFSLKVAAEGLRCPETLTRGESTIGALRRPLATPRVAGGSGDDARQSHQLPTTGPTTGPTMGPTGRLRSTSLTAGVSGGPETGNSNGSLTTQPPHEGWDRETQILVLKVWKVWGSLGATMCMDTAFLPPINGLALPTDICGQH